MSDPAGPSLAVSPGPQAAVTSPEGAAGGGAEKPRGLLSDAWRDLRHRPMFWISASLILLFIVLAAVPQLFTSIDPSHGDFSKNFQAPSKEHWFGTDHLGRDVYARTIYGARASIVVALAATIGTTLLGGLIGVLAGFRGGWADSLVSRFGEVFSGVPFILGAIVILFSFNAPTSHHAEWYIEGVVAASLMLLSWPISMRIMRSSILAARHADYVIAARALGAGTGRIISKHLIPNCLAPLLVYSTVLIGAFIGAEATLSFLGIGLRDPVVSWGIAISDSQNYIRIAPYLLYFPAAFLVAAVLAFVMMGEAVREALDPKLR